MVHHPLLSGPAAVLSVPWMGLPSPPPPLDVAQFAHTPPQFESRIPIAHRRHEAMATAGQPKVSEHPASCTYQDEPQTWITNALRRFTSPSLSSSLRPSQARHELELTDTPQGAQNRTMDWKPAGQTCKPAGLCFFLAVSFPSGLPLDLASWTCNLMRHSSLVLWNEPG